MYVARERRANALLPEDQIPLTIRQNPRETMRRLPAVLQPFLTWLTGMPLYDQEPLINWSAYTRTGAAFVVAFLGIGLSCVFLSLGGWYLAGLLLSIMITTNGMRSLYMVTEHYCIHDEYSRKRWVNVLIGDIVSTLLLAAPVYVFRHDHPRHHATVRRDNDPDVIFLVTMGYRRGMTKSEFRRHILWTCLSPVYHLRYLWMRLVWNFTGPVYRVAATVAYVAVTVAVLTYFQWWTAWLIIWFVPAVILFQASSLINYQAEHLWDDISNLKGREALARVCVGRFCGEPVPDAPISDFPRWIAGWSKWWGRLLLLHLPYRVLVLQGDLSQHDLHHRRPHSDWANAAYARRDDIIAGTPGWPLGYIDVWGSVVDHLDACVDPWGSPRIVRHEPRAMPPTMSNTQAAA